jgi:shikimate kinase
MVLNPANVDLLRQNGIIVKLHADLEVIISRVKSKRKKRPLIKGDVEQAVRDLLAQRAASYDVAEFAVDTGKQGPDESARIVYEYVKEKRFS